MYVLEKGNCIDLMKQMADKSVDCIVTDPPYGIGIDYGAYIDTNTNLATIVQTAMPEMLRIAHRIVLTPGINNCALYPQPTWILAWTYWSSRPCRWGFQCWQPVFVYGKDPYLANRMGSRPDLIKTTGKRERDINHPCPKPLDFMLKLIERVSVHKTDRILDPFMGSGTTGVAAVKLGRRFIGFDINPAYVRIAKKRILEAANDNRKHANDNNHK